MQQQRTEYFKLCTFIGDRETLRETIWMSSHQLHIHSFLSTLTTHTHTHTHHTHSIPHSTPFNSIPYSIPLAPISILFHPHPLHVINPCDMAKAASPTRGVRNPFESFISRVLCSLFVSRTDQTNFSIVIVMPRNFSAANFSCQVGKLSVHYEDNILTGFTMFQHCLNLIYYFSVMKCTVTKVRV